MLVRRVKRALASQQDGEFSEDDEQPRQTHDRSSALPPLVGPRDLGDEDSDEEPPTGPHGRRGVNVKEELATQGRRSRIPDSQRHVPAEGTEEQEDNGNNTGSDSDEEDA